MVPLDGTREPFNLSRHPDPDCSPVWSPDGTRIAFVGRRDGEESDIYWFNLVKKSEEETGRDRKLKDAIAAMEKKSSRGGRGRGGDDPSAKPGGDRPTGGGGRRFGRGRRGRGRGGRGGGAPPTGGADDDTAEDRPEKARKDEKPVEVKIDFEGIHDRMHRIRLADVTRSAGGTSAGLADRFRGALEWIRATP